MFRIRAQFDGHAFIPEERVNLRAGDSVELSVAKRAPGKRSKPTPESIRENLRRLRSVIGILKGRALPDSAFDRGDIYKDRL